MFAVSCRVIHEHLVIDSKEKSSPSSLELCTDPLLVVKYSEFLQEASLYRRHLDYFVPGYCGATANNTRFSVVISYLSKEGEAVF